MTQKDVEAKEETIYKSVFIHLNTQEIMQIFFLIPFIK